MITLHESNITSFPLDNGIGVLSDAIIAYAEEEINSVFEFYMEYDSEGRLVDELKEERIIKAKAQDKLGYQLFRIYSITKNHENDNIIVNAQHITYDLANNFVEKMEANRLTKKQVMEKIGASTVNPHPFNVTSSNTTTVSSTNLYRTNPLQMIAGMEGSVLQIWGGQIERDNFHLILHDRRGHDDGVEVTYEKNITGLTAEFDISSVITRIFPFVFIEATDDSPERLITVSGKYIDSPHINDYEVIRTEPIDYSNDDRIDTQDKTDAQIRQQLTSVAKDYFKETGNDKITSTMDVAFMHLWETEEYKDVKVLELVGMGDTVTINHSKLKVDATAIVNYIKYDCISHVNEEVKLGNVKAGLTDSVNKIDAIERKVEQAQTSANQAIVSANGKNTTYYGPDEPVEGMQKGDLWFEVIDGQYTRTYRYDGIEWQLIVDMDSQEAKAEAQQAKDRANEAVNRADNATQQANTAITKAQEGFNKAQDAIDELANLEFGGRNLVTLSNVTRSHATVNDYKYTLTKTSTSGNPYIRVSDEIFEDDTEYVVTFKVRKISGDVHYMGGHSTVAVHSSTKIYLDGELVTEGGNGWSNNDRDSVYPNDNKTHQYMIKFRTKNDVASDSNARWYIQPNRPAYGSDFVVEIWDWQLEKGNKATDWTPAPEDVDQKIDVVANDLDGLSVTVSNNVGEITSIQATTQGLQTNVSNLQGDVASLTLIAGGLQTRMSDAEGNINTLQVTSQSLAGRLSDAEGNLTTLTATVDGLQTTVSDIDGNVANLTVVSNAMQARLTDAEGNINTLTLTSQSLVTRIGSLANPNLITHNLDEWEGVSTLHYLSVGVEPNEIYTFKDYSTEYVEVLNVEGEEIPSGGTYTFRSNSSGEVNIAVFDADFLEKLGTVYRFKLEEGTESTAWTAHDEDIYSQYSQLNDAINLRVTKGDVINQINLDTSGVLISGKHLILDGNTTVRGTFKVDGSAHIKDASIGTAQIGTIDAAIANIINLSANSIVGGILQSQNDNITFDLNRSEFIIRGGGQFIFHNSGNGIKYIRNNHSAGMIMANSSNANTPLVAIGTDTGSGVINANSPDFNGIMIQAKELNRNLQVITGSTIFSTRTDLSTGAIIIKTDGSTGGRGIFPQRTGTYNYDLGSSVNKWRDLFVDNIKTGTFHVRNAVSSGGWRWTTVAESGSTVMTFRGISTSTWNYNIGSSGYRINRIYLSNSPDVSSDERLKTDIKDNELGLDFINDVSTVNYRLNKLPCDVGNLKQNGVIAQQLLPVLFKHGVDINDTMLVRLNDDGYYSIAYEQFISPLIKSVQELDTKFTDDVNYLKLKVQYLEGKIKQLEGAA